MNASWRERSKRVISDVLLIWMDATGKVPSRALCEKDKAEIVRLVHKAYPFGQRKMHPYKIWLSEMKHLNEQLYGLPERPMDGLFSQSDATTGGPR